MRLKAEFNAVIVKPKDEQEETKNTSFCPVSPFQSPAGPLESLHDCQFSPDLLGPRFGSFAGMLRGTPQFAGSAG